MKIHITNLYNFNRNDMLVEKQHRIAEAGIALGYREMGIFSFPVETDTPQEVSKRLGHSTVVTTSNTYSHMTKNRHSQTVSILNQIL